MKNKCDKVLLFYEFHYETISSITILNSLTRFYDLNFNTFCLESYDDMSKEEVINLYSTHVDDKSFIKSFNYNNIKNIIDKKNELAFIIANKELAHRILQNKKITDDEKNIVLDNAIKFFESSVNNYETKTKILKSLDFYNMFYCGVNVPSSNNHQNYLSADEINKFMSNQILNSCNQNGDTIALVGASHFPIAAELRKNNVKVVEFFLRALKMLDTPDINLNLCITKVNPIKECPFIDYKFEGLALESYNDTNVIDKVDHVLNDALLS